MMYNIFAVARYHRPNPLDSLFLAIDEAWGRCGLWGADIHLYLETGGAVDVDGLRDAVRGLHRLYPATAARLVWPGMSRTPAWRLDGPAPDVEGVVTLEQVNPENFAESHSTSTAGGRRYNGKEAEPRFTLGAETRRYGVAPESPNGAPETHPTLLHRLDELLAGRLDLAAGPPLRIYVLRGLPAGDVVVFRWPHALMDARGGEHIIREIARLYDEKPNAATLSSVGDESRGDFGVLRTPSLLSAIRWGSRKDQAGAQRLNKTVGRLSNATICTGRERQRVFVRRFTPDQFAQIRTTATQVCGFARVGDFIRACAIRALHETIRDARASATHGGTAGGYSTLHLLENRKRRDPAPVCHNVFTTMPMFIPADIASDRRATADLIQSAAARMIEPGVMQRRLAGVRLLAALGTSTLAREMARGLRTGRSRLPVGLVETPSLPMGFMNLFAKPLGAFCGVEFVNLFGLRAASPIAGLGVNVCTVNDRLNISGVHVEPHVDRATIDRFLDLFVGYLTDSGS